MKKICFVFVILSLISLIFISCDKNESNMLSVGDKFSVTGVVDYSDEPSDIGQEYCFISGSEKIDYLYIDIYGQESKWSSDIFFTKGNDTNLLKEYVGQEVTVSGVFDTEVHGIPYITNIKMK